MAKIVGGFLKWAVFFARIAGMKKVHTVAAAFLGLIALPVAIFLVELFAFKRQYVVSHFGPSAVFSCPQFHAPFTGLFGRGCTLVGESATENYITLSDLIKKYALPAFADTSAFDSVVATRLLGLEKLSDGQPELNRALVAVSLAVVQELPNGMVAAGTAESFVVSMDFKAWQQHRLLFSHSVLGGAELFENKVGEMEPSIAGVPLSPERLEAGTYRRMLDEVALSAQSDADVIAILVNKRRAK